MRLFTGIYLTSERVRCFHTQDTRRRGSILLVTPVACALFRAVLPLAYVQCAAAGRHGTLYRTSAQSGEQHAKKWYVRQVPRPCNGTTILQERSRSAMDRPFRFSDNKTSRVPLPEQSAFFSWRVDRQTAFLR